uniref:Uncharacterized protein n=1 Tax=Marmota marmota marmota TaxID=9994 RepID=A0A8C5ZIQ6_MARMA
MGPLTSFRRAPSSSPAKASSAISLALGSVCHLLVSSPLPMALDTRSENSADDRHELGLLGLLENHRHLGPVPRFPSNL